MKTVGMAKYAWREGMCRLAQASRRVARAISSPSKTATDYSYSTVYSSKQFLRQWGTCQQARRHGGGFWTYEKGQYESFAGTTVCD